MSKRDSFVAAIKKSYTTDKPTIRLGSGILDGEIIGEAEIHLPLRMMNRHGLVAGATGSGKTRTIQVLAEQLSQAGVPVFLSDIKGDLSGFGQAGQSNKAIEERCEALNVKFDPQEYPIELYSLSGKLGSPMRATVLEFGPTLLAKVLDLNATQTGVLAVVFKYADDKNLPMVDLSDLKMTLNYLAEGPGAAEIKKDYGSISTTTASTILRKIVALEQQGVGSIFGEKSFDIDDLLDRVDGKGVISLLNVSDVQDQPALFSTFMLSLLVEIYSTFPEAGDLDKPKLVFFLDEAHLLFKDAPKVFLDQIEQIVRLIRSKGVGVFFCSQMAQDIPDNILSQLGNRVQHVLRTFTPNDVDNLKKTVKTFPRSDFYEINEVLTTLGTGQALVTVLNEKGIPTEVAATHLLPPTSVMGPLSTSDYESRYRNSQYYRKYKDTIDPESAYEILTRRVEEHNRIAEQAKQAKEEAKQAGRTTTSRRAEKSTFEKVLAAPITRQIGRELVRGVMGMLTGKKTASKKGWF